MPNREKIPRIALSIDEVAKALGISRRMVYVLMDNKTLTFIKVGNRRLIAIKDLDKFLDANRSY